MMRSVFVPSPVPFRLSHPLFSPLNPFGWLSDSVDGQEYVKAHEYAVRGFGRLGREYMWIPPRKYRHLAYGDVKGKKLDRWGLIL
jgi:hypothetical protein